MAEVLITLGIIGVVAAITIPTLINNFQKAQYVGGFKEAYSLFSQAFEMAQMQNGKLDDWDYSSEDQMDKNIEDYVLPQLKVLKNCGLNAEQNCFASGVMYKSLTNADWNKLDSVTDHYKITLSNGMGVAIFASAYVNCTTNKTACYGIHIDVNGQKGPNQRGRDVFTFYAYPYTNDIIPGGVRSTYNATTQRWDLMTNDDIDAGCGGGGSGVTCGGRILRDGEMKY